MLARIKLRLQLAENQSLAELMRFGVEQIEALIQFRCSIAPKSDTLAIGTVVEVIPHANVGRPRCLPPKRIVVAVIALKRSRKRRIEARLSILYRAYRDSRRESCRCSLRR